MPTYDERTELLNQITKLWSQLVAIDATYANANVSLDGDDLLLITATGLAPFVAFCAGNAIVDLQSLRTIR